MEGKRPFWSMSHQGLLTQAGHVCIHMQAYTVVQRCWTSRRIISLDPKHLVMHCRRAYGGVQPPTRTEIDVTELPDKFVKSSQRVLERMVSNAKALKAAAVSAWQQISRGDRNDS